MRIPSWLWSPLVVFASALLLTSPVRAGDPAGTTLYMTQLRTMFATWDRDNDKQLDREELALAFRGPKAKAYVPAPVPKGSKEPDLSKYPDALFMTQLDQNGDEKISRKEFEAWAREYAVQIRDMVAAEERMINLQKKMIRATRNELAKMEAQMRNERAAMEKMGDQMRAYERYLQQQVKGAK